jgi:hypothetical protein
VKLIVSKLNGSSCVTGAEQHRLGKYNIDILPDKTPTISSKDVKKFPPTAT